MSCDKLVDFVMEEVRALPPSRQTGVVTRASIEKVLTTSACGQYFAARQGASARPASYIQSLSLSSAALALYDQINTAIDTTANSSALATALLPVLDAAALLTAPGESDIITSTASVAVSSRENWEVQLTQANYNPQISNGVT